MPERSLTVLRGPSGSGKTTLVNILGGLDLPTSGSVVRRCVICGLGEIARDELRRTAMGFVFQGLALVAVMSAFENVEFALRVAGVPGRERRRRAEECLGLVGLRGAWTTGRTSSRAASSSAWPSPGRSPTGPG